ncbi:hypothetical protein J2X36_002913 [Methylobacterium sp. BE186]|uniref:hypothetical protein n=1 Tax=Methylobacterium sp. BE186 TaxID=2817715 RepID=UPI002857AB8B|nr:hypothetical protein [Methylobacterium sp. BE186]MDR7038157.1 hypothetical protein [Methylobacterium sp. BE186]
MRAALYIATLMCLAAARTPASAEAPAASGIPPSRSETAAKLAGLAGFVNLFCPALRSDPDRLKAVVGSLGYEMPDLETGDLRLAAHGYIEAYRKNVPDSCARASALFGTAGTVVPGLVLPR